MKKVLSLLSFLLVLSSTHTLADHHSASFEARQDRSEMNVTSVEFRDESTVITAEGQMGEYGKVYVTYNMTYAADGVSGAVEGVGRGVVDAETVMTGRFTGIWRREGSTVTMHNTVNMNDGSQNFDIITFDARGDTLIHKVFILR